MHLFSKLLKSDTLLFANIICEWAIMFRSKTGPNFTRHPAFSEIFSILVSFEFSMVMNIRLRGPYWKAGSV